MPPNDPRPQVRALQGAGFEELFRSGVLDAANQIKVPIVDQCFSEWLPGDGWYDAQSSAQRRWDVLPIALRAENPADRIARSRAEVVLVETSRPLRLSASLGGCVTDEDWSSKLTRAYASFRPQGRFADLLARSAPVDVGVSIRRGDLLQYFPEARQDLDELARWVGLIAAQCTVAVFSDDATVRESIVRSAAPWSGDAIFDPLAKLRTELEPWAMGVLEFVYLAHRCRVVTGTPASSFAREAALFGGLPYFENLSRSPEEVTCPLDA